MIRNLRSLFPIIYLFEYLSDGGFGAEVCVLEFLDIGNPDAFKSRFHLLHGDTRMANEKCDVFHVLSVVAAHHFGQNQINGIGAV